jgi:hypothetical protein
MANSNGMARLGALVGTWHTTGTVESHDGHAASPFTAIDSYEWLPGRHFLVHHWDAAMPEGRTQGIEIIGHDAETDRFPMRAYDSNGQITTMTGTSDGTTMQFEGTGVRFTGRLSPGHDEVKGTWETQPDGADWRPWMHVTLTRQP